MKRALAEAGRAADANLGFAGWMRQQPASCCDAVRALSNRPNHVHHIPQLRFLALRNEAAFSQAKYSFAQGTSLRADRLLHAWSGLNLLK